jgi:branched-chain amino acid transport system substrate-binding protein
MEVRMRKVLSVALALALVAAFTLPLGCQPTGGGGGAAGTTVKLGFGAPLTQGAVALGKGMQRGVELAVKDFNEGEGKAAGITVEIVVVDDQGDPKTGVTVANQLASDPAVIGVVGHLNSGVSIPASVVYQKANLVQVSPASTNPDLTNRGLKNVFRTCTIDPVQGAFAAERALKDLGFKTAFVVDDSTPYGTGLADEFEKNFKAGGGTSVGREKTGDKDTDFSALVTKIKAAKPDVLYYGGIYNAGALLAKQAKEGGVTGMFFSGDGIFAADFIKLAGAKNAEGDYATSVGLPLDEQPKGQEYKTKFEAAYPGEEIQAYDTYAYDAANVILSAMASVAKASGADKLTTTESKQAIIAAVATTDMQGVTGAVKFDEKGDTLNKAITLYVVKGGEWVPWTK